MVDVSLDLKRMEGFGDFRRLGKCRLVKFFELRIGYRRQMRPSEVEGQAIHMKHLLRSSRLLRGRDPALIARLLQSLKPEVRHHVVPLTSPSVCRCCWPVS